MRRQTAHKDVMDGPLTNFPSALPTQAIFAISDPVKLHLWVNKTDNTGYLSPQDRKDWKQAQVATEHRITMPLESGDGLMFHCMQTHAGDGEVSNFRLFVGSVNSREGYSYDTQIQQYYETEDVQDYDYALLDDYLVSDEDEIHDDHEVYEEYFKRGSDPSKDTRTWTIEQLQLKWGRKTPNSIFLTRMADAYKGRL